MYFHGTHVRFCLYLFVQAFVPRDHGGVSASAASNAVTAISKSVSGSIGLDDASSGSTGNLKSNDKAHVTTPKTASDIEFVLTGRMEVMKHQLTKIFLLVFKSRS
jgi:hypothetical protein